MRNVEVRVLVPEGRSVKAVHLVRSGHKAPFTVTAGYAEVTLPTVHIAELVHLVLGA